MDAIEGGLLDEMTRRAQEKLLVFQVGQEVQVNLQNIEQALDAYFRDPAKRAELAAAAGAVRAGAGRAHDHGAARRRVAQRRGDGARAAVRRGLGRRRRRGRRDGRRRPVGARPVHHRAAAGLGHSARGAAAGAAALRPGRSPTHGARARRCGARPRSRRIDIDVQKQKVQALYEDWKDSPAEDTRAKLEQRGGRPEARRRRGGRFTPSPSRARPRCRRSRTPTHPTRPASSRRSRASRPTRRPRSPPRRWCSWSTRRARRSTRSCSRSSSRRPPRWSAPSRRASPTCRDAPHDRESLTTIRRGFHTLKGSGRMVGLNELGEMAWQCEQVMNKWLKDEKPASPAAARLHRPRAGVVLAPGSRAQAGAARRASTARRSRAAPSAEERRGARRAAPAEASMAAAEPPSRRRPRRGRARPCPATSRVPFEPLDLARGPGRAPRPRPPPSRSRRSAAEPMPAFAVRVRSTLAPAPSRDAPRSRAAAAPSRRSRGRPRGTGRRACRANRRRSGRAGDAEEEPDVAIGPVTVSRALFAIYVDEAEQHVAAASTREMAAIEADRMVPVSAEFMRAAHTLASSSRTTGFESARGRRGRAGEVARGRDRAAARIQRRSASPATRARRRRARRDGAVVARPRRALPRDDVIAASLARCARDLRVARLTGEGTHLKMPGLALPPRRSRPKPPRPRSRRRPRAAPCEPSAPVADAAPEEPRRRASARVGEARSPAGGARCRVRGRQGPAQDQGRRRPRPAADLPRRGEGDHAAGVPKACAAGAPRPPTTRPRARAAAPPAYAEGQRAHGGPHAPGRARPRPRGARERRRRASRRRPRRPSRRSRSASTASRARSSASPAARTSSRPSPSKFRWRRSSSTRRTSPRRSR